MAKDTERHQGIDDAYLDMTEEDLPPRYNRRWSAVLKAKVVAGIELGLISVAEARYRYALSREELVSWQQGFARLGVKGLTVAGRSELQRSAVPLRRAAGKAASAEAASAR